MCYNRNDRKIVTLVPGMDAESSIWFRTYSLEDVNDRGRDSMVEHLAIRFTAIGNDQIAAEMPVDARTKQPLGFLHGGASVALAETVGSTAANMCVDFDKAFCVGMEINANHLRPVTGGTVTAVAEPIHLGRKSQVWSIRITDDRDRLICISRLTMAVVERTDSA